MTVYEQFARVREQAEEALHGLYHGMIEHPAFEQIEDEAMNSEDAFFFACFADAFGIPSPVSYYTAELLPYIAEDFEGWERRMWDRDSAFSLRGDYHF